MVAANVIQKNDTHLIAIFSGGLDSTTLVYYLLARDYKLDLLSFNYGQRHHKELEYATRTAEALGLRHDIIELDSLADLLAESGSSLVSSTDVPEGHYAQENMKATVVPNRNMIMLSMATGVSIARGYDGVVTGVHAGDHFIYPDCRPGFISALNMAVIKGNEGFTARGFAIGAPFVHMSKADIALQALELGVPLHETWSCYKGEEIHCGKCGTCVERLEAIYEAQARYKDLVGEASPHSDETQYEDNTYWKAAIKDREEEEARSEVQS